ncbi:hypothetical protein E2C01_057515 [Portunus trituberculatus]|uniref:Uncharacterized protein n=1 Tax=Portunus trituberculatus TaxID=210409 RepID=A0A5B7H242_PORTR|nr:hypothetical protein [Portunus trituberculatus]
MQILIGAACVPGTVIRVHLQCLATRQAYSSPTASTCNDWTSGTPRGVGGASREVTDVAIDVEMLLNLRLLCGVD